MSPCVPAEGRATPGRDPDRQEPCKPQEAGLAVRPARLSHPAGTNRSAINPREVRGLGPPISSPPPPNHSLIYPETIAINYFAHAKFKRRAQSPQCNGTATDCRCAPHDQAIQTTLQSLNPVLLPLRRPIRGDAIKPHRVGPGVCITDRDGVTGHSSNNKVYPTEEIGC